MILLDIYVFQVLKLISQPAGSKTKIIIYISYWGLSIIALTTFIILPYLNFENLPKGFRNTLFAVLVGLFFAKLIASVFFLIDDMRRGIQWIAGKLFFRNTEGENMQEKISRSVFLSWAGMLVGGGLFTSLIYGFSNRYRYQVKRLQLTFSNLPAAFKGLKIVHFSDVHSGSFNDKQAVLNGVEKIMKEKPDVVFFTGDLVNDRATEMRDYIDVFNRIQAPMGVYSTLGNHDYGDYVQWIDMDYNGQSELKKKNLEQLKQIHAQLGWRLLINEHVVLEKNGEKIALLGVENWSSKARFPKYGDLKKAYHGAASYPFKILLSHDPSHWEAEVRKSYTDIDLMLSGHTHGMQFGVEIPGFKWSPVQYIYKQWAGLYEEGAQKLYVNRGYGFIGYPGRVGILPEITILELS